MPSPSRSRPGCRRAPMPRRSCWPASTPRPGSRRRAIPRPVLMRITGPAWTAAEDGDRDAGRRRRLHRDRRGARRPLLREGLCALPHHDLRRAGARHRGTWSRRDVAGFVAGSGKTGVRGPVVSREGALVEKAFLAGMVSGLGQGVSQAFQPQAVATGTGAAVANTGLGDIGRAGLGAGASIRRAEGRRLHDPPRRAVPAGGPAPGRHQGDAGVPRGRPDRRARAGASPCRKETDMTHATQTSPALRTVRPPAGFAASPSRRLLDRAYRRVLAVPAGRRRPRAAASRPPIRRCRTRRRRKRRRWWSRSGGCGAARRRRSRPVRSPDTGRTAVLRRLRRRVRPLRLAGAAVRSRGP